MRLYAFGMPFTVPNPWNGSRDGFEEVLAERIRLVCGVIGFLTGLALVTITTSDLSDDCARQADGLGRWIALTAVFLPGDL